MEYTGGAVGGTAAGVRLRLLKGCLAAALLCAAARAQTAQRPPQYPAFPSETPENFAPATGDWDHDRRDLMIPMRDGVMLHTIILVPKGARSAPILLTRTP